MTPDKVFFGDYQNYYAIIVLRMKKTYAGASAARFDYAEVYYDTLH